jgi:transposase
MTRNLQAMNARHLKQVPGRRSDVRDCQWIAQLLQCGLLKGSFIPPRAQRELRDLTRHRTQLVEAKTRTINRIQKVLEDANIKLAAVASDVMGVSGRAMIQRLIEGETDPYKLAHLAQRQLRGKILELEKALEGKLTGHHRFPAEDAVERTGPAGGADRRVGRHPRCRSSCGRGPAGRSGTRHETVPERSAFIFLGRDVSGNEESAGKRRRRRITPGNRWLKQTLAQAGWAASHTKNTYLASHNRRLAGHRGRKRALIANRRSCGLPSGVLASITTTISTFLCTSIPAIL